MNMDAFNMNYWEGEDFGEWWSLQKSTKSLDETHLENNNHLNWLMLAIQWSAVKEETISLCI